MNRTTILVGDCRQRLAELPDGSVQTCVTSPPYFGLRDYGVDGQIGLEASVEAYVAELVAVFGEVRRTLRDDGTLWLNLGDSYTSGPTTGASGWKHGSIAEWSTSVRGAAVPRGGEGLKPKDLIGVPWRVAFALQADGWYLRSDIIWHKPNPMPESVTDRPTKAHEYLFLLAKSDRYFYDADAIAEPAIGVSRDTDFLPTSYKDRQDTTDIKSAATGASASGRNGDLYATRNKRTVWSVSLRPFSGAHFATFPPQLIEPCIRAGSREGDTVVDPFGGAGTTALVCNRLQRDCVLLELNPSYAQLAKERIEQDAPMFAKVELA